MSEPSGDDGKGSNWLYSIDLPQGVKDVFGASGPELPQKCRVEGDRCLKYSTMVVYVSTAVAAIVYALGYVKLTQSVPVHMHLSPRILPTIAMSHNEDFPWKYYAYCDRKNKNYDCPMETWAISPEGCAKIFPDMKHLPQLNTAAGDGVFLPTVWRYEEMSIKPTISTITPTCDVNKTCTLSDDKNFCSCTERNESFFMPGIIEQQMTLIYQMHMEIPDLSVMAGGGVNTPMCEDFLIKDDEVDHQIERANCTDDPHPLRCAMTHFDLSFIRCDVQLRSGGKLQGRNYNIKSSSQKIALNKHSFKTAWWGQWKVDLTNVLQRVAEVNETSKQHPNKQEVEDPYICSFMSTGGSIMVHHFIDPVDPDKWSWRNPWESFLERLACRLGLPSRMVAFHNRTRRWPCFRLRVEIEYLPFQAVNKTDIVIHDAKTGAATLQRHQHRGIKAVVAQGGGGTVQRFTATSFIVGIFSIFDLWVARMFLMECVILFCLCGPASELYRRALTKKVSLAQMMRAWVCRTASALWIHEAVQESRAVSKPGLDDTCLLDSKEELVTKITTLLKKACPGTRPGPLRSMCLKLRDPKNLKSEESKDFEKLREFVEEIVYNGTIPAKTSPRSGEDESDWHDWLLANESKGDLRSADLRAIFDHGASSWKDFEDPPPPITHGVSNTTLASIESESEGSRQRRPASSGQRDPRTASLVRHSYSELESQ